MEHHGDDPTLTPGTQGGTSSHADSHVVPALSILWHSDLKRIGDVAALTATVTGVTRGEPAFSRLGEAMTARPLEDVYVSRQPLVEIIRAPGDTLEIRPGPSANHVELDGSPLSKARVVRLHDLERGVLVMALRRRVALCLHTIRVPAVRGPDLGLLGISDVMEDLRRAIRQAADMDVPVLIRGETGTGKELVARALVTASHRARGPFIALNMAALSPATAAAELFGYEKGAFTGAVSDRPGHFAEADGGTLFLDEVGLAPPDLQTMLLRVLETGEVRPLGARRARNVNVRVLAATDAKLQSAIAAGTFSEALFHRLARFQIEVPSLRDRRQDIGQMLLHFLESDLNAVGELARLGSRAGEARTWLDASSVARIALGNWQGNVRHLRNVATRLAVSSRGQDRARIDPALARMLEGKDALSSDKPSQDPTPRTPLAPHEISPDKLMDTLLAHKWSPGAAAAALGISRNTLYQLIEKHPEIRTANSIPEKEILRCHEETKGDLALMSERLRVSPRSLQLRLRQLLK
jgi:two-component system nitrogen regulation response regulator GlnG